MILYFDTETTGLRPGHIIQLAYILDYGDNVIAKNFYFKVEYIEPSAMAVHGITLEKLNTLSGGMVFYDHINEIEKDFLSADLLVAHNFTFDFYFMVNEFKLNFKQFQFKESFDTMKYFTPILKLPTERGKHLKYPKLNELFTYFDVYPFEIAKFCQEKFNLSIDHPHDAAFDTAAMFLAVKNACEKISELDEKLSKYLN